jgi:hypothetical protein
VRQEAAKIIGKRKTKRIEQKVAKGRSGRGSMDGLIIVLELVVVLVSILIWMQPTG